MRLLIFKCLLLATLFNCNNPSTIVKKVKVVYVSPYITTIYDIPCYAFYNAMKTSKKTWESTDKRVLSNVGNYLNDFTSSDWDGIDTRAKLKWETDSKTDSMCFDKFGHFSDSAGNIYENPRLFNFLKEYFWKE